MAGTVRRAAFAAFQDHLHERRSGFQKRSIAQPILEQPDPFRNARLQPAQLQDHPANAGLADAPELGHICFGQPAVNNDDRGGRLGLACDTNHRALWLQ